MRDTLLSVLNTNRIRRWCARMPTSRVRNARGIRRLKRERLLEGARYLLNIESYRVCAKGQESLVKPSHRKNLPSISYRNSSPPPRAHGGTESTLCVMTRLIKND